MLQLDEQSAPIITGAVRFHLPGFRTITYLHTQPPTPGMHYCDHLCPH